MRRPVELLPQAEPESVVQTQLDAYNAHDLDAFVATYAEDVELFEHPSTLLASGHAQLRERYAPRFADARLHCTLGEAHGPGQHRGRRGVHRPHVPRGPRHQPGRRHLRSAGGEDREGVAHPRAEGARSHVVATRPPRRTPAKDRRNVPMSTSRKPGSSSRTPAWPSRRSRRNSRTGSWSGRSGCSPRCELTTSPYYLEEYVREKLVLPRSTPSSATPGAASPRTRSSTTSSPAPCGCSCTLAGAASTWTKRRPPQRFASASRSPTRSWRRQGRRGDSTAGAPMTIVASTFYGGDWCRPGHVLPEDRFKTRSPAKVLTQALRWLKSPPSSADGSPPGRRPAWPAANQPRPIPRHDRRDRHHLGVRRQARGPHRVPPRVRDDRRLGGAIPDSTRGTRRRCSRTARPARAS